MARTFSVDARVYPSSLLERARRAASENGAILVGEEGSGRFSHELVRGEYRMGANGDGHHNGQALAAALACGGSTLVGALGLGVGRRRRGLLSRPTPRRPTPIATTVLPFVACLDTEGTVSVRHLP